MSFQRIPAELTTVIIDFCYNDRGALKMCGLVCKEWLVASRYHLFKRIFVHQDNALYFLELVASPYSTFSKFVHNLQITDNLDQIPLQTMKSIASACKEVSVLGLDWITFYSWSDHIQFLSIFQNLERLTLSRINLLGDTSSDISHFHHITSSLNSLTVNLTYEPSAILGWLRSSPSPPRISHLDLREITPEASQELSRFMETMGENLNYLSISFFPGLRLSSFDVELIQDLFTILQVPKTLLISPPARSCNRSIFIYFPTWFPHYMTCFLKYRVCQKYWLSSWVDTMVIPPARKAGTWIGINCRLFLIVLNLASYASSNLQWHTGSFRMNGLILSGKIYQDAILGASSNFGSGYLILT